MLSVKLSTVAFPPTSSVLSSRASSSNLKTVTLFLIITFRSHPPRSATSHLRWKFEAARGCVRHADNAHSHLRNHTEFSWQLSLVVEIVASTVVSPVYYIVIDTSSTEGYEIKHFYNDTKGPSTSTLQDTMTAPASDRMPSILTAGSVLIQGMFRSHIYNLP